MNKSLHLAKLKKMLIIIPAFFTGSREIIDMKTKRSGTKTLVFMVSFLRGIIFITEFVPSPGQSSEMHS